MPADEPVPPGIVSRAATIARGPHACPSCECPTWAEPPVPWTDLRDYVVRCDACDRPIAVRIDRDRILRRGAVPVHLRDSAGVDTVTEVLDTRGRGAFALRLLATSVPVVVVAALVDALGASIPAVLATAALVVVPAALWAPSLFAIAIDAARSAIRDVISRARELARRPRRQEQTIEVAAGRWDQWQREEKLRLRDRAAHPDAVLRELERVLDERELRRVRMLADQGQVPAEHLDDLLRYRRSWRSTPQRPLATG